MQVEGSMTLRVLVLALVIVGVRVEAVGAIWSDYRCHNRNVSVRFCIAIEILAALGALFRRFFDEFHDTRRAFVELFNSKYFTSFAGMPQRLGILYCSIHLILLSLAHTLSQTLGLAPSAAVISCNYPTNLSARLRFTTRLAHSEIVFSHSLKTISKQK
jgi:hypothetical protein